MARKPRTSRGDDPDGDHGGSRGRPPNSGQIRPGEKRNPWGRAGKNPQKAKTFDDLLDERAPGTNKTLREHVHARIITKAVQGDNFCLRLVVEHDRRKAAGERNPDPIGMDLDFTQQILAEYEADIKARARDDGETEK